MIQLEKINPKAILISVCLQKESYEQTQHSLEELEQLAKTAEIDVIERAIQNRDSYHPKTFAGTGFIEQLASDEADMLIFDNELTASQNKNIAELTNLEVIDRTEVILTIFQKHAQTNEAKLQVKLAELKYQLPRLKRLWTHLDRERSSAKMMGGSASRGMGEKQKEIDQRKIREEIAKIEKQLREMMKHKVTQRKSRSDVKKVCLVGYTNVGKSTLFNALTEAHVLVQNILFATLDTTSRAFHFDKGREIILSDTVGFISNLPHHLVASFRATLKDVEMADYLLHVVDISSPFWEQQLKDVHAVLDSIGAGEIPRIIIFNKVDVVENIDQPILQDKFPQSIFVSAKTGINLEHLKELLDLSLNKSEIYEIFVPHTKQNLIHQLHELGKILNTNYAEEGILIRAEINNDDMYHFKDYVISKKIINGEKCEL